MPVFVDKLFRMEKLLKQKKKDSVKIINSILKSLVPLTNCFYNTEN